MENIPAETQNPISSTDPFHVLSHAATLNIYEPQFRDWFDQTQMISKLEETITNQLRAASSIPDGHPDKPTRLSDLGNCLANRFELTRNIEDLDAAIKNHQQAVSLTPDEHPAKPTRLNSLSNSLASRFELTGNPKYLEEVIMNERHAASLVPEDHSDKPGLLNNLGISLRCRFNQMGGLKDIEEAIQKQEQAVLLTPDEHPDKPAFLDNLGISFQTQFEHTGKLADLEEAIKKKEQAVLLTPDWRPDRPAWLNNLGISFQSRCEHTGELKDLEEAIKCKQQAVLLTPDDSLDKLDWLNNLGNSLESRFEYTGELKDLEEAVKNQKQAVSLTPDGHIDKATKLNNLGISLQSQFEYTGVLSDLEEAIRYQQLAVSLTPDKHTDKSARLNNLGSSFQSRFERTGGLNDLKEAIRCKEQAVSLTLDEHPDKPSWLDGLGNSLRTQFKRTGTLDNLEKAIQCQHKAVLLTKDKHPDKPERLNNLGNSLRARFEHTEELKDIEEAIENQQQALLLTPDEYIGRPERLSNLGLSFQSRFVYTKEVNDLEEAIKYQQQAVSLTPDGHPSKPARLTSLGVSLHNRYDHTRLPSDLESAISHFRSAANSATGPPSIRSQASIHWARLEANRDQVSALLAYRRAIDLIPQIAWIGDPVDTRHSQLKELGDLPREAAAFALDIGNPELALEWLEQGRSVVWNQLFNFRTSVVELDQAYPDVCAEFIHLSSELQNAATRSHRKGLSDEFGISLEEETQYHHRLAEKWDLLMERIRSLPGFGDFLLPKKASTLIKAAAAGPVVVINVHQSRCDALVLEPGGQGVLHIPLKKFLYKDAENMQKSLKRIIGGPGLGRWRDRTGRPVALVKGSPIAGILLKLYINVVHPILQGLHLTTAKPSDSENIPRIWWCPTGPLTFLPLHAAGRDIPDGRDETANYVVSSYIPTVNALLEARATARQPFTRLLGIAMTSTPNLCPLPNAEKELVKIAELFHSNSRQRFVVLKDGRATSDQVLSDMATSTWIHLACHASQDEDEPTRSGFSLHDRRLTITDIIAKPLTNVDFAFLSACETATGDELTSDEAVHITGAMLGAGYRSVIGTMWSIPDETAPIVARKVYDVLFSGGEPNSERAARAVHEGVKKLRESGHNLFHSWVPYVHYGA